MTTNDVAKLLATIAEYWPAFPLPTEDAALKRRIAAWHAILRDYSSRLVFDAIHYLVQVHPYPTGPHLADICRVIAGNGPDDDDQEAIEVWPTVIAAVKRYGLYRRTEALRTMSARTINAINVITWQRLCHASDDEIGLVFRDFCASYNQAADRRRRTLALSAEARRLLDATGAKRLE